MQQNDILCIMNTESISIYQIFHLIIHYNIVLTQLILPKNISRTMSTISRSAMKLEIADYYIV